MRKKKILLQLKTEIEKNAELTETVEKLEKGIEDKNRALKILNSRVAELENELKNSTVADKEETEIEVVAEQPEEIAEVRAEEIEIPEVKEIPEQNEAKAEETAIENADLKQNMVFASSEISKLLIVVTKKCNSYLAEGKITESKNLMVEFTELRETIIDSVKSLSLDEAKSRIEALKQEFIRNL